MTDRDRSRDRLIELLEKLFEFHIDDPYCIPNEADFADDLLANGVIVPPCKVGDTVYHTYYLFNEIIVEELKVLEVTIDNKGIRRLYGATEKGSIYCFSRDYNLNEIKFTKEEAEKALKERE